MHASFIDATDNGTAGGFSTPSKSPVLCRYQPSYKLIQFWHSLPGAGADLTGEGLSPTGLLPWQALTTDSGSPDYPHFCPIWLQIRVSHDPLLMFNNSLQLIRELREPLTTGLLQTYSEVCKWALRWAGSGQVPSVRASVPVEFGASRVDVYNRASSVNPFL